MTIGLTQTENPIKNQYYITWLTGGDAGINVITLSTELNNGADFDQCDALVLSGGIDVYPAYYGNASTQYNHAPEQFNTSRDLFEMELYKKAMEAGKPVLGICRGLQLINCIEGGTLQQDLGTNGNATHWAEKKPADKTHSVNIRPQSLLYKAVECTNGMVNSAHHQAIGTLAESLQASALSADGTIEAIEWKDKLAHASCLMAVQWHPERMDQAGLPNAALSTGLRNYFVQQIISPQHLKS